MKFSVYDIIYRNDSNIRRMLENDLLFMETGFVAFRDVHDRFWLFYKKAGLLVPGQQEYIDRTYGTRDLLPRLKKIKIGEDECDCSLPPEEYARDFFMGLSRISICSDWGIERQLWKVSGTSSSVLYDAPIRMVRPEQFLDRVSTLRCAFTKERDTNRRNFTNFDEWEYINTYEMTFDGKIVIPQAVSEQEENSENMANSFSSQKAASAPEISAEASPRKGTEDHSEACAQTASREEPEGAASAEKPEEASSSEGSVEEAAREGAEGHSEACAQTASCEESEGAASAEKPEIMPSSEKPEEASSSEGSAEEAAREGAEGHSEACAQTASCEESERAASTEKPEKMPSSENPEEAPFSEKPEEASSSEGSAEEAAREGAEDYSEAYAQTASCEATEGAPSSEKLEGAPSAENPEEAPSLAMAGESVPEEPGDLSETCGRAASCEEPEEVSSSETMKDKTVQAEPDKDPSGSALPPKKKVFTDIGELLDCDKRRCRMESYEETMLYDIKRGHWDICEYGDNVEIPERGRLVSRDPRKDIKTGVVGIDFGTKSTVVVRQDDTSAIIPIRIGAGELSAELRENDYENPTIIECTDLDEFIKKYYEKAGRPETSCEDFFVSYDAYRDYYSCPPSEFYAYYADLKQWANHEKENVVVWDKKKHEYHFGANGSKDEKIINPIELYAYYIGMYINNMRNGIYMKYLMSFPVGYSRETRQLIVSSFEKGIRKSLPSCVLEDEECMKEFSVRLGISEPAAYAVTALEMSDLEPQNEKEQYRYGIFDFGGGTADFGFGIWRGASEKEYEVEGYDYVLECFGADSDITLGGEKILELLAYAVFKKNRGVARRRKITCSLPYGAQAFLGSETLLSDSQIAQRNMSILKEELRPLWHQEENWEKKYRHESAGNGISAGCIEYDEYIEPCLYDIDGNKLSDCRLAVDTKGLISLIKTRIQRGIDAFFKCMYKAFQREGRGADYDGQMYIFLAGNSSRSIFVKELFEENIRSHTSRQEGASFKLVEPLNEENRDEYVPNGKTSVAYGLIKSREGSSIKVEKNFETDAEQQTRFKYYLGRERRHHFDCRLSPVETEYGTWIRFQGAARGTVRIYYTTNPTADVREEPPVIDNIPYKELIIDPQPEEFLFIRACEPAVIEYAVAGSPEMIDEKDGIRKMYF